MNTTDLVAVARYDEHGNTVGAGWVGIIAGCPEAVVRYAREREQFGVAASTAEYFASEAAVRAATLAIQAFDGYGCIDDYPVQKDDYPVQKYMRDGRVMTLDEGSSQIQELLIGRAETGINAFV